MNDSFTVSVVNKLYDLFSYYLLYVGVFEI